MNRTELLAKLRSDWQANARLRLATRVAALLAIVWIGSVLAAAAQTQRGALASAQQQLLRLQSLRGQEHWLPRAADAAALRRTLEEEFAAADSPGLAQAALQAQLVRWTQNLGSATRLQISRAEPVEGQPQLLRVGAQIDGNVLPEELLQLLLRVESHPQLLVVESLRFDLRHRVFGMQVRGYFRLPAATPAKAE